ncbi:uncharacterized protein LOC143853779 [Tasmannia lanceolata]|uniref:uncharacterized protein LOC143853779 n=1 Tax=Tasmannia lanceolata TaxID=3420 RepID=UPI004064436D
MSVERKPKVVQPWDPPPSGHLKLNFDGSSFGNPGPAGIGGVHRDELGIVAWAYAGPIGIVYASEAEFRAVHQGIKFLAIKGADKVIIEGDSSNVISWLQGLKKKPWRFDRFFYENDDCAKSLSLSFKHVRRTAKEMADNLARIGVSKEALALFDSLPP